MLNLDDPDSTPIRSNCQNPNNFEDSSEVGSDGSDLLHLYNYHNRSKGAPVDQFSETLTEYYEDKSLIEGDVRPELGGFDPSKKIDILEYQRCRLLNRIDHMHAYIAQEKIQMRKMLIQHELESRKHNSEKQIEFNKEKARYVNAINQLQQVIENAPDRYKKKIEVQIPLMGHNCQTRVLREGDVVLINTGDIAIVRYVGPVHWDHTGKNNIGVEFSDAFGNTNGTVHGKTYFQVREKYGEFYTANAIKNIVPPEYLLQRLHTIQKVQMKF